MGQIILFAFLALFPFGQIIKIGIINPIDFVVVVGAVYAVIKKVPQPKYFKHVNNFLIILAFSWLVGFLGEFRGIYGGLYLIRLASYFYFSLLVPKFSTKFLLVIAIASAIFGWIQYFWLPNLTTFTVWGWDDHLYRMTGAFLDPGFLGIILALGAILAFYNKKYLAFSFLAFSILFTYSRASYLALLVPSFFMFKKFKYYLLFVICFLAIVILLPRKAGEGVRLERTASINQRLENYTQTFNIFRKNPLFGVGFNNICLAKNSDYESHSCSGADSSLLFLLATGGVLAFISFVYLIFNLYHNTYSIIHIAFAAVLIHSLFSNSLFYPWVMGWMVLLLRSKKDG